MPNIKGTNGNDVLIGTAHNDRIVPLLGGDFVDGAGGVDALVIDYSGVPVTADTYSWIYSSGDGFGGFVSAGDGQSYVSFQSIERLELKLDAGGNFFSIDGSAIAQGARIDVNAGGASGGSEDILEADFSALGTLNFNAGSGKLKIGGSTFTDFDRYFLSLGSGNDVVKLGAFNDSVAGNGGNDSLDGGGGNDILYGGAGTNKLIGGAGDDSLLSQGRDNVNGGSGFDWWEGNYTQATADLAFSYDGSSGSLSNGTVLTSVEFLRFLGGAGNDQVSLTNAAFYGVSGASVELFGGDGADTLAANLSGVAEPQVHFMAIFAYDSILSGSAVGGISFDDFEAVTFTGGNGDWANVALFSDSDIVASVDSNGTLTSNIGVTLENFVVFQLQLGDGNDDVTTGSGNDTIQGMDGDDRITGAAGGDSMWGGEGADTFIFNSEGDFGTGPNDWIADFSAGDGDKIDLQNVIEGEFTFIEDEAFSGTGGAELRSSEIASGVSYVQGDVDGNGFADFGFVVSTAFPLTGGDFFL